VAIIGMAVPTFYRLAIMGWKTADYTHAWFILPVSLWLIWQRRTLLVRSEYISKGGVALFAVGLITYLYAGLNAFMFLDAFSFVLMMWAIFLMRFTGESVRKILFPLVYLLFLVPPPGITIDSLTMPLKTISTYGSFILLKLFHLPVEVSGAILKVGDYELFMADACSGFRSMVTLLALGSVYAYLQDTTLKKKWVIFLSVVPLGIIGNILRITATGMIAYFIGMKYAEGFFHDISGMILFVFTIFALMGISELLSRNKK
jgi:exosortase